MRENTVLQTVPQDPLFWAKVDTSGDCWLWTGYLDRQGYGRVGRKGRNPMGAHRYAWELTNGPIPEGKVIRHSCDNPPCVNPVHLQLGTQRDNIADRQRRGRHRPGRFPGEAHHSHKLTNADVLACRAAYDAGEKVSVLARRYGLNHKSMYQVVTRRTWRHIVEAA